MLISLYLPSASCQHESYDEMLNDMYRNTVPVIKTQQLAFEKKRNDSLYILDCRSGEEYEVSHIQNSRHVGFKQFDIDSVNHIPRNAKVILYCSVGYRSERVGERMKERGYKNIYNLYGGIFQWVNNGYPVFKNPSDTTNKVHAYSSKWGKWLNKGEKIYDK